MLIGIGVAVGIVAGIALALLAVQVFGATGVGKARRIRRQLLEDAERDAEALRREAELAAREQALKLRAEIDSELSDRRESVLKIEERVLAKEEEIERKLVELSRRDQGLADRETHLRQLQDDLKQAKLAEQAELERIAGMSLQEAKAHLLERGRRSSGTTSPAASACSRRRPGPSRSGGRATSSPTRSSASPRATRPRRP